MLNRVISLPLALLALTACATPNYQNTREVVIDGKRTFVSASATYPGQYFAIEEDASPGVFANRTARNIRAIEAVSGCKVIPGTVEAGLKAIQAAVTC
ncbi:MAG: hypothetical protein AAFR68_08280 [Pseudomonadota bacterium]